MLTKKPKHILYAAIFLALFAVGSTASANPEVYKFVFTQFLGKVLTPATETSPTSVPAAHTEIDIQASSSYALEPATLAAPMFMTIIQGANEEVICPNDGSTLAKFFLCGTSDVRTLTLSQSGSSYQWQKMDPSAPGCVPTVIDDCPTSDPDCAWNTVGTAATYDLDSAGEFRVRVDSGPYYYFKATLNPLDPQLIFEDIICGQPGRVEVTNVPAGYEYSLNSSAGPYQNDPYFDIATPGNYTVWVRLAGVSGSTCLFPSNQVTVSSLDMTATVVANDILCAGELGSIDVSVSGVPGFYTYRLIKNGVTVDTFGPDAASNYTFANVSSGIYEVRVQTNDCNELITLDINNDPIEIGSGISPIAVDATAQDSFGCGAASVDVEIDTSGGTPPYRYSLDGGTNWSGTYTGTTTFTVTSSGTYNILVEDANGCQNTASVDVEDLPPPVFTITTQDANCGGSNNGSITVNVTNGYGYTLEFSIDNGINYQVSNVFNNLAPGSYDVVVRYQQGSFSCTTPTSNETVSTPSNITGTATPDSVPTCLNENGGQITISGVAGGVPPYDYSIGAGFSPTNVFTNLGVGTYTPQIRDANGCVESLPPITFNALDKPTDMDFVISSLDCLTATASVTVTGTGGTPPYTYEILAPAAYAVNNGNNPVFPGLGLGTYTFRITDTEGCSYDEAYAITDISSINVQAQTLDVVTCVGDSDGAGRFLVDGFATTYSYQIDANPVVAGESNGIIDLTGLTAGSYVINVTDEDTNCTDTATLTIQEPAVALAITSLSVVDMSCQNGNIGAVTVNTVGGWGGNRYTLTQPDTSTRGPQSSPTFSALSQGGLYTVSVEDANGCIVTDSFTLTPLTAPTLTLDAVASDFCYDNTDAATMVVIAAGGLAPYQYRINGGPLGGSPTFSGLTPGNYTIEVVDANDCRDTVNVVVEPEVTASATAITQLNCGGPDAEILVNISNGYTSGGDYDYYEVSIDGAPYTSNNNNITGNSFIYTIPNDGSIIVPTTYQFEVFDAQGCRTETNVVTITPPETIAGTAVPTHTTCGDNNGIVTLVPDTTQGVPPYEFSDNGGATFSTQNIYSGYAPGTYNNFVIRDARGCVSPPLSVTINASVAIDATIAVTDAICTLGAVEGAIDVTAVSNGSPDYTYTLLDINGIPVATVGPTPSTTANFPNVVPGTYTVVTTDANGCEEREVVQLSQNQITLTPLDVPPANCTDPWISYRFQASGGTAPYEFRLVGDPVFVLANVNAWDIHDFAGQIAFGITYFIEVRDAVGCTYIEQIDPIIPPSPVDVTASAGNASCLPGGNGVIDFTVSGLLNNPANFTVELQDTDTGAIVAGPIVYNNEPLPFNGSFPALPPGNYQVLVNDDDTQCDGSALVSITTDIPALVVDNNEPATCNAGAFITVRGTGGTPGYQFAYVPTGNPAPGTFFAQTTFEIAGPYPADYDFYVQDSAGCINFTTVTVTQAAGVPTPTVDVVNQCTAVANYTINVTWPLTGGSGLPEDTFEYDIGGGFQSSPNFTVPNPGDYTIVVRDGNGCTNSVVARVFDFFAITASATSEPTCNAGDGVITVNTTGGSGNFEFQLDDGINPPIIQVNNPVFTSILPGSYSILVTDLDSNTIPLCTDTATVDVTLVTNPVIAATPQGDVTCTGANDGYINTELQPGTDTDTPLLYVLYDGATPTVLAGPQGSPLFDNLAPGTYQVEVISDRGCTDRSGNVVITEPTPLQIATTNTQFTCDPSNNRFNTATITIYNDDNGDGTGTPTGTAPYTYTMFDGTTTFANGTNNVFEVVDNGTNQTLILTATDANGCQITDTVTINAPTGLTFSFNVNPITCDATGIGVNPGSIDITILEGPGSYDVEILPIGSEPVQNSGGSDTVSWAISTPGDYIFAVTDVGNAGCTYLTPIVTVPEYNTIDAVIAENEPVTCYNGTDGELSIQINNYIGAYNYEVFSRDNFGVETSTGVTGSFDTSIAGQNPAVITGLPAGNLVVHIEALDTPFCDTVSNVATVRQPDRALTVTLTQTAEVTCAVPGLGEVFAVGDGGWGSYEFQLIAPDGVTIIQDFPDTNDTFSGLDTGTYTVNIRDAEGCVVTNTINLALPTPIYADIQVTQPLQCNNDNNGAIQAFNESGGQGPGNYLYQLNRLSDGTSSGLQTTPDFANLSAGDYTITVFDGWDCSYTTVPITVQDPPVVIAELVELQPPGCGSVGIMELTVTNPEPGMSYFFRRAGTADPFQPFDALDPLAISVQISADITIDPGPFQYDVQNSNGCPFETSNQISLDPAAPLVINLDLTNATINCFGEATGIIRAEAFGGIGNYQYTLLNSDTPPFPIAGNTERPAQASGIFRDLGPGTYWVFAQSGGCTGLSNPITIVEPPPLVLDHLDAIPVSCFGDQDGQLVVEASGGTGVIRYAIADQLSEFFEGDDPVFPNRKTFTDLEPRDYTIIIQDELGCTITQTITITQPMALVGSLGNSTPEICLGDNDGTVTLNVAGGTPPYEFAVNSNDPADFAPNPAQYFDNLIGGDTYVFFIRDSMGCETNVIVPVGIGVDLQPEAIVNYGCEGIFPNNSVEITLQDPGQYSDVLFALDPLDPTDAITALADSERSWGDLAPGDHTVYIYHMNGCTTFVDFSVDAYDPLTLVAEKTGPNEVTATASGGFGDYEFFFNGDSYGAQNTYEQNFDGIINVRVVDAFGCETTVEFPFDFTGMLDIPNFFTPNGDNENEYWYPRNSDFFPNMEVKIYDRYGRVVAILDQVSKWDGTYDGKPVPTGDYWYVVNANDKSKQQYVGHFTLYR